MFCLLFISSVTYAQQTPVMTQKQLVSLQQAPQSTPFVLLDVRTEEEYKEGHIAGAVNISHDILAQNLSQLSADKQKAIVVYCRSGRRAAIAEALLRSNGFENIKHLQGDMKLWQANDLPIVRQ